MKRNEPESIGDVLRLAIQESNMSTGLNEAKAIRYWPAVIGEPIARQCGHPYVKAGVMTIQVPNAALRHELNMNRSSLAAHINRLVGNDTIKELKFR